MSVHFQLNWPLEVGVKWEVIGVPGVCDPMAMVAVVVVAVVPQ